MAHGYDFIANTSDGVYAVDSSQTIVLWNEAASNILGYPSREVLGRPCYDVIRGRNADGCLLCHKGCSAMVAARSLSLPPRRDVATSTKDGREVWLNVTTIVASSRTGRFRLLVHIFRDVTKRHESLRVLHDFATVIGELERDGDSPRQLVAAPACAPVNLTPREREILGCLAAGESTARIAERLFISPRTVRSHVGGILTKLGVSSRLEAVASSMKNGLL